MNEEALTYEDLREELEIRRKKKRIEEYLELTGLADVVMNGKRTKALLSRLNEDYDEHPEWFKNLATMCDYARRHGELLDA